MSFFTRGALLGVAIAFANSAAFAGENVLPITAHDRTLSLYSVELERPGNGFLVDQTSRDGSTAANRIEITVSGNENVSLLQARPLS